MAASICPRRHWVVEEAVVHDQEGVVPGEIDELDPVFGIDHDVLRLHVAMHDAVRVDVIERLADPVRNPRRTIWLTHFLSLLSPFAAGLLDCTPRPLKY